MLIYVIRMNFSGPVDLSRLPSEGRTEHENKEVCSIQTSRLDQQIYKGCNLASLFGSKGADRQIAWITVWILHSWNGDVNVYATEEQLFTIIQRN